MPLNSTCSPAVPVPGRRPCYQSWGEEAFVASRKLPGSLSRNRCRRVELPCPGSTGSDIPRLCWSVLSRHSWRMPRFKRPPFLTTGFPTRSFLDFDSHRFKWLTAQVLLCLLGWRFPNDITGLVLYRLDLARRVFDFKILIGEEDGRAINGVGV